MNHNAAAGPDQMSPRIFHLLVNSDVSPEAGVTGLSVITRLVGRLSRRHRRPNTKRAHEYRAT